MVYAYRRGLCCALIAAALSGCATQSAHRGAVAYNRAFDQARNEILLLNILRARDSYPQQYSTVSQVVGGMGADISATPVLANIVGQLAFSLGGTSTAGFRSPTVTVTPLETKEFRAGMMKAIRPEYVNDLLEQKWNPQVVENLTAEAVRPIPAADPDREPGKEVAVVPVAVADTGKLLLDPALTGVRSRIVGVQGDKLLVQLVAADTCIAKLPTKSDCGLKRQQTLLRSPAAMVQFLAKSLRDDPNNPYFQLRQSGGSAPADALVSTRFAGQTYYIDRNDRFTVETLALLADIIGFQTTDAVLDSSKPTLAISQ